MIQELIKKPLAEELLFGKLVKGGAVKVTLKDGKLAFDVTEAPCPPCPSRKPKKAAKATKRRPKRRSETVL